MNQDPSREQIVELLKQLRNPDEEQRADRLPEPDKDQSDRAEKALRALGLKAVPELVECLMDRRGDFWAEDLSVPAANALGRLGFGTDEVVDGLVDRLDDWDDAIREAAVLALGELHPTPVAALPRLITMLHDEEVNWAVFRTLKKFGPAAAPATRAVAATIGRRYEHGPYVLASIGTRDSILTLLDSIAAYGGGDRHDFEACQGALGGIADVARPMFEQEFHNAKPGEYSYWLYGLSFVVKDEQLVPLILHVMRYGDASDRRYAIGCAARWPRWPHFRKTEGAIEQLLKLTTDPDIDVCVEALSAVAEHHEDEDLGRVHNDRLLSALKRAIAKAKDEARLELLKDTAARLGLEILPPPKQRFLRFIFFQPPPGR